MDSNPYKTSENQYFGVKIGTGKVFDPRNPIPASDFDNFEMSVSYNAMFSGQNSLKISFFGLKFQKLHE